MNKIIDLLLILGLAGVVGFYVSGEWGEASGLQPTPSTSNASNASIISLPAFITTSTTTIPSIYSTPSSPPTFSAPTSKSILSSPLTPIPTATLQPSSTPTSEPTPTATSMLSTVDQEILAGIEQGNQIIAAIESFSQTQGFYPPALSDLLPNFLSRMPFTAMGQPFFYRVFDRTNAMSPEVYWLSFKVMSQEHVTCTYFRRLQYWDCNFASP